MADRLRTTMPKLAGAGMGFELWRLLVRGHEAPEQPLIQRAHRQRWSFPTRCTDLSELRVRLPEWECWGRDLEAETGTPLVEVTKIFTLDQLIPADLQAVLDDRPELVTYALRLQFVRRRLDQDQHRALARLTNSNARVAMGVGNLDAADEG